MYNIIVADDHAVVRTGLQLIFQDFKELQSLDEVSNGDALLQRLQEQEYDCAIVDLNMPGKDSLDLVREIIGLKPAIAIVIYSMNTDEQLSFRLFKMGVRAYINKEEDPQELLEAVKIVLKGEKYLTAQQRTTFANQLLLGDTADNLNEKLTDREYQIACLLAEGKSKTEIAEKLQISKNTISNHRNNVLKKLNLANNAELTRFAIQHNLIS